MALTKVSTGVVDMSGNTGGLVIAKGNGTDVSSGGERPTCNATILGSIRENTDSGVNKVEVCTSTGWQFLEEAGPTATPLTVDYLVVAGGGAGGGYYRGGGGGAGELKESASSITLSDATPYTVAIGAGGIGVVVSADNGSNGNNGGSSTFYNITSIGGGGGSPGDSSSGNTGSDGGSGGGAGG